MYYYVNWIIYTTHLKFLLYLVHVEGRSSRPTQNIDNVVVMLVLGEVERRFPQ